MSTIYNGNKSTSEFLAEMLVQNLSVVRRLDTQLKNTVQFLTSKQPLWYRYCNKLAFLLVTTMGVTGVLVDDWVLLWLGFWGFCGVLGAGSVRSDRIIQARKSLWSLSEAIKKLEKWIGASFDSLGHLNENEVQKLMNNLMLEVVEPVFELQEQSAKANPLDWRPEHARLMEAVNERFDALNLFGYMPRGGYGLFFQHVRYMRDDEPEKFILAT